MPVIDCSGLFSAVSWPVPGVIEEIRRACREWGFFQIVNTGIPQEVVQQHFQLAAGCVIPVTCAAASNYKLSKLSVLHCYYRDQALCMPSLSTAHLCICSQLLHWTE